MKTPIKLHDIRMIMAAAFTPSYLSGKHYPETKRLNQAHNRRMSRIHGRNATMYRIVSTPKSVPVNPN
jgi:hypothetical protein